MRGQPRKSVRNEEIVKRVHSGESFIAIMRYYNLSKGRVSQIVSQYSHELGFSTLTRKRTIAKKS